MIFNVNWYNWLQGSIVLAILALLIAVGFALLNIFYGCVLEDRESYKKTFWGFMFDVAVLVLVLVGIGCGIKYLLYLGTSYNIEVSQ